MEKYYVYDDEDGRHYVRKPEPVEETSFWDEHPGAVSVIFLGGMCAFGILATLGTIELIGAVTARKVVKKLKED